MKVTIKPTDNVPAYLHGITGTITETKRLPYVDYEVQVVTFDEPVRTPHGSILNRLGLSRDHLEAS